MPPARASCPDRVKAERAARAAQTLPPHERDELVAAFAAAIATADVDALRQVLADDVVLVSDGGADHHAARRPVLGVDKVARFLLNVSKRWAAVGTFVPLVVNHQPAFLAHRRGRPLVLTMLELGDGEVVGIQIIVNPDKLARVAPFVAAREHGR